jgi:hypothetical protein
MTHDAGAKFEALNSAAIHLRHAREQHARLLQEFLAAAAANPAEWQIRIAEEEQTLFEGPLDKQAHGILAALARIPPGEGAGCPDRVGCTNTGQFGNKCFYICKTVKFG